MELKFPEKQTGKRAAISIYVPGNDKARLDSLAKKHGVTPAALCRIIVTAYLDDLDAKAAAEKKTVPPTALVRARA